MRTAMTLLLLTFTLAAQASPYIILYEQRIRLAEAESRRQRAETELQAARLQRARALYQRSAISREEYETIEADYRKSVATGEAFQAQIKEAEAMLEVVRHLVRNGQEVPLCRL